MKKLRAVILTFLLMLLGMNIADAKSLCSYEEQVKISSEASSVKLTSEEAQGIVDPSTYVPIEGYENDSSYVKYYNYFKVKILNVTENITIKLENDVNDEVKYISYDDTDEGTYTFDWKTTDKVTTFTYTVLASKSTSCLNEKFNTGVFVLPKYNSFSNSQMCENDPDYYLCQKYVSIDFDYEYFEKTMMARINDKTAAKKEEEKKNETTILEFIKNNKLQVIIGTSVLIVGGVVTIMIVIKKRRRRVI